MATKRKSVIVAEVPDVYVSAARRILTRQGGYLRIRRLLDVAERDAVKNGPPANYPAEYRDDYVLGEIQAICEVRLALHDLMETANKQMRHFDAMGTVR